MSKAIVLLSGGQDSTTCLYWTATCFDEVVALTVLYGQRHRAEVDAAREISELARIRQIVVEAPALGTIGDSGLVRSKERILPSGGLVDREMPQGLPTSFVPCRNIVLLSLAAAVAVREGARDIVAGMCQTDFSGYPDCRRVAIDAIEAALCASLPSSVGPLRLLTPMMWLTKAETVCMARRLPGCWGALGLSVTCYEGRRPGCGTCPACELRARGFREAGELDPAA